MSSGGAAVSAIAMRNGPSSNGRRIVSGGSISPDYRTAAGADIALRLLQLDQAAADLPAALDLVLDIRRVAPAHGARHRLRVLHEAREHLQQRLAVVEEHVAPHHRIGRGDAGEVAKARGGTAA